MAKDYPWFKFKVPDWMMGKIQRQKPEVRGVFLDLMCRYWQKQCVLSVSDAKDELEEVDYAFDALVSKRIIKINGDNISISFLDEQWEEKEASSKKNADNGQTGGRPVVARTGDLTFYLIECFNDNETFLKVGISQNSVYKRFGTLGGNNRAMPYSFQVIFNITLPALDAMNLEADIQNRFNRYSPQIKFCGHTECVKVDASIIEYITKTTSQKPSGLLTTTQHNPLRSLDKPLREEEIRIDEKRVEENEKDITPEGVAGLAAPTPAKEISFSERCNGFITKFNELRKTKFQVTDKVKKSLKARLARYTPTQIIDALKTAQRDKHHIENNFRYLTPEYILREEILERYLNATITNHPSKQKGNVYQTALPPSTTGFGNL